MDKDPLLTPQMREWDTEIVIWSDREVDSERGSVVVAHAAQREDQWKERRMDAAFFNPENALNTQGVISTVTDYYRNIDQGDLPAVRSLFASDSVNSTYEIRRSVQYLMLATNGDCELINREEVVDTVPNRTTYHRCDRTMNGKREIDDFYDEGGRGIRGEHIIEGIVAIPGFAAVRGRFQGLARNNDNIDLSFGDVWHFQNDSPKISERRTYLSWDPEVDGITLNKRPLTHRDLLRQTSFFLQSNDLQLFEIIGDFYDPDSAMLLMKQRNEVYKYINSNSSAID